MKRALTATVATLGLALGLCSSANAAVSLGFAEAKHEASILAPGTINRGDEYVAYSVKLKNVGSEKTSAGAEVAVALPDGVELAGGSGSGWTCRRSSSICTSSSQVEPGAEYPKLKVEAWILPAAPGTVTAGFTAFGGGATGEAFASDSFILGPATGFGLRGITAGTCSEPALLAIVRSCGAAEEQGATPYAVAGGHPFAASSSLTFATRLDFEGKEAVVEDLRDLFTDLPAGFIGNPQAAAPLCTVADVRESSVNKVLCPESDAVGGVGVAVLGFPNENTPLYRVVPEEGYAAAFAFRPTDLGGPITIVLRAKVRSNGDYGISAIAPWPPQNPSLLRVRYATLCGYGAKTTLTGGSIPFFSGCKHPGTNGAFAVPFLTNPTRCVGGEPVTTATLDSYQHSAAKDGEGFPDLSDPSWKVSEAKSPAITGCEALTEAWVGEGSEPTSPSLEFNPDTRKAAAPAAYSAHLHIPQRGLVDRNGLATAHLKDTTVALPSGLALNPSAADGLGACSEAQAGYLGNDFPAPNPIHFSTTSSGCPENSKLGTVEVSTPLLTKALPGSIYLAEQGKNPFGSDFAVYLVIDDRETGIKATLAGKVEPSEAGGRITASFKDNPQVPVEDLSVNFFGGERASLVNPDVCGEYTTHSILTPWSAADPDHPLSTELVDFASGVAIDSAPTGRSSCPTSKAQRPFDLGLTAGVANATAGAHSAFALKITRDPGEQELSKLSVTTPPGFAATLKGVAICPQSGLDQARGRTQTGQGTLEIAQPSCPPSSQVGTTTIGAGAGRPYYVKTGRVYLTGPYRSAPLSLTFIVPAVAGPFDLGVQVVRTALRVNPKTAQITAESDQIPQILDGVPLNIREIRIDVDRPGFALNPTSCAPMSVGAQATGSSGAVTNLSRPFQVGNCGALKFKPNLGIQLHGGTKRGAYQRLSATVTNPEGTGYANIARAAVTLPHSEFLAQEHIRTVCTRVQFAAHECPAGSIYGRARAISPLLDAPLSGPVYLRSSDNPLPDLVAALKGPDSQPIEVELSGRTDSVHGGIRNTFDVVPDAPVSKFTLQLQGGKKSLIVNSRNLCDGSVQRATVRLSAQNGVQRNFRPVVKNDCGRRREAHRGRQRLHRLSIPTSFTNPNRKASR
jgi:hypothetical protein